jgi:hypothetical protein
MRFIEVRTATLRQINGSIYLISMRRVAIASVGEAVMPLSLARLRCYFQGNYRAC